MKKSLLFIRNSKPRQYSANGPRIKKSLNQRVNSTISVQDFFEDQPTVTLTDLSQKSLNSFFSQELIRFDKFLDAFEISRQNQSTTASSPSFSSLLENFYLSIKLRDNEISNRLMRVSLIFEKYFKKGSKSKKSEVVNENKSKDLRENFTQTVSGYVEEEIIYPDTSKDIQFIKSLMEKFDKLKAEKLKNHLVDLHENLSKIDLEVPSPGESPEPLDVSISSQNQKISMFLKVLRMEIRSVLSKNNVTIMKLNKAVQFNSESRTHEEAMKEKLLEIVNLRNQMNHRDKEVELLKENLSKCRNSLMNSERRIDSLNLELIQVMNKFRDSEDQLKNAKQRINFISQVIAVKTEKKKNIKRLFKVKEKELVNTLNSLKKIKEQSFNLAVNLKVAEEKLDQIQEAWNKNNSEGFQFKNVNAFDVASKYSMFKPVENECLSPEEIITIKNSDTNYVRGGTLKPDIKPLHVISDKVSPRSFGGRASPENNESLDVSSFVSNEKSPTSSSESETWKISNSSQEHKKKDENFSKKYEESFSKKNEESFSKKQEESFSKKKEFSAYEENFLEVHKKLKKKENGKPLKTPSASRRSSIVFSNPDPHKRRLSALAVENFSTNLSTIIENSPATIPMDSFADFSESFEHHSSIPGTFPEKVSENYPVKQIKRRGYEKLTVSLGKEVKEPVSRQENNESIARTPLLQCLINEKEMIYKGTSKTIFEKPIKPETKSQEVQCTLIGESPTRRTVRSPAKIKKTFQVSKEIDESTLENFKKLGLESGLFKENEDIDSLPPAIQVEIIKCFEGHDSKKCEFSCIHLRRALAIKIRDRGVPYPMKTIFFNSQID
jgi:hypothetical protein